MNFPISILYIMYSLSLIQIYHCSTLNNCRTKDQCSCPLSWGLFPERRQHSSLFVIQISPVSGCLGSSFPSVLPAHTTDGICSPKYLKEPSFMSNVRKQMPRSKRKLIVQSEIENKAKQTSTNHK